MQKHYGYESDDDVQDNTCVIRRDGPDLWSRDKCVAIAIGVLREATLCKYLLHFDEVVHLPLPRDVDVPEPTHFRTFVRNRSRVFDKQHYEIWGDTLLRGRTRR